MSASGAPLLSIVIATRNRAELLPSAVSSAQQQTGVNLEIVLVDDGSSDSTWEVVQAISAADHRVRPARTEGRGPSAARNVGISMARGRWLAFLDDDDLLAPNFAADMVRFATARNAAVVACQGMTFYDAPEASSFEAVLESGAEPWLQPAGPQLIDLNGLLQQPLAPINAGLFSTPLLREIGGFDEQLEAAEDYDLWLRIALRDPIPILPEYLVLVRRHRKQASGRLDVLARSTRQVLERHWTARASWPRWLRRRLRRRLAFLAREESYAELLEGHADAALRAARAAIGYWPWAPKTWAYLALAPFPRVYQGLRWLLRRRTPHSYGWDREPHDEL